MHDISHSLPSSFEVKNEWTLYVCLFNRCLHGLDTDKFTFLSLTIAVVWYIVMLSVTIVNYQTSARSYRL